MHRCCFTVMFLDTSITEGPYFEFRAMDMVCIQKLSVGKWINEIDCKDLYMLRALVNDKSPVSYLTSVAVIPH